MTSRYWGHVAGRTPVIEPSRSARQAGSSDSSHHACPEPARWAACSPVHGKRVAEHRSAALGLLFCRLVLDDVPVFDKDTILDPDDVRRDPIHGRPEPREPSVDDDEVAVRHDHRGLVFQRRRHALDEVEKALAARSDMRAVLNVCGRPVALSRDVVSLVEQGIEGVEHQCLIPLLFRLTHSLDPPSTGVDHCAVKPPSTSKLWPMTNEDLLEESQITASAISSDLPMRPMGCMAVIVAWFSALSPTKRRYMSVSIAAGSTALMRIPCLPNSAAADFVRPMTACLLAA